MEKKRYKKHIGLILAVPKLSGSKRTFDLLNSLWNSRWAINSNIITGTQYKP